jgi:hypothetical protein
VSVIWYPTGDMIGDYVIKPLQGALFRKFRDQIMGVTPARDPGPGKTDSGVGKTETSNNTPNKSKVTSLVLPGKEAEPYECWESNPRLSEARTRASEKVADPAIFNQSTGKIVSYAHAACMGQDKHSKSKSLLHLTSKG